MPIFRLEAMGILGSTEVSSFLSICDKPSLLIVHCVVEQMDYPDDREVLETFECTAGPIRNT